MGTESWGDCDYLELPEFYNERLQVARKEHKCSECRLTFPAGSKYKVVTGVWDSTFLTYKTCPNCLKILDAVKEKFDFAYAFGDMLAEARDAVRSLIDPDPGYCFRIGRMLIPAWREQKRKAKLKR